MFKTHTSPASLLRIARVASGLSQEDLAAPLEKSRAFIYRLEVGGRATLTPELAEKIGAAVGVDPSILFCKGSR